jgi:hypothetical protein
VVCFREAIGYLGAENDLADEAGWSVFSIFRSRVEEFVNCVDDSVGFFCLAVCWNGQDAFEQFFGLF